MRNLKLVVVFAVAVCFFAAAIADGAVDVNTQKSTAKVRELQHEWVASLKSIVEIETRLNEIGRTSPEAVLDAKVQVYEAEAAAAETQPDRIVALQRLVDVRKECEAAARARKLAARDTEAAVLKAKADRLEAEIRLERARALDPAAGQTR